MVKKETTASSADPHLLTSWKEVAVYLGKGVRTVQRWERELGLPVRRPYGKEKHVIVALPEELDEWVRTRMRPRESGKPIPALTSDGRKQDLEHLRRLVRVLAERTKEMSRRCSELVKRTTELRAGNRENRRLCSEGSEIMQKAKKGGGWKRVSG